MRKKTLLNPIEMPKSLVTICVLMLLLLLVPCEIFAIGKTTLVSVSSTGVQGNDDSSSWGRPSISSDGRYVAFDSHADNLVEGDSNNTEDAFVHDRQTGQTTLVSVSSAGVQGNSGSDRPSISADGRYVAFSSSADNLVEGDSNNDSDVFVHEMQTGQTTLVSVSSTGVQANNLSYADSISSNGRYVVFLSDADNLVDGDSNNAEDVFVHEMQTGQTTLVSVSSEGVQGAGNHDDHPSISSDGPYVAYSSNADNLVNGDSNNLLDVFVHEMQTGQTTLVSVSSTGVQGNDQSWQPSISADGRYVAFKSNADNLVEGDSNDVGDVFVHEMQTGQTTLVSVSSAGVQGNSHSGRPSISADGRYVAFRSDADNLVEGDSNNARDVFVHDRQTGQTTRVSVSSAGVQGNDYSWILSISSDGRYVAFTSSADNLVDGDSNNNRDVFVHDRFYGLQGRAEIIGTWSSGIWYWDEAESEWTKMTASTPTGDIAAGDFTGDGIADVASCWDSGLWYQDGTTLGWTKVSGAAPGSVTAGDVTGDGQAEIIGTWGSGIWIWDVAASEWTKMTSGMPSGDITAGDFTGDSRADVASIWDNGLWYQDGATLGWAKISGTAPDSVTAGDVTGDGRFEIIGTWSDGIWYWDVAASKWTKMTASNPTGEIAAGDFTGDSKADVASIWDNGLWYQDGATLGWTKVSDSAPDRLTAGNITGN